MPKFFVAGIQDSDLYMEHADRAAAFFDSLQKKHGHSIGERPLFKIEFHDNDRSLVAEVGKEIDGLREKSGIVIAIIETEEVINVFTNIRISDPIPVGREEVFERVDFDP